MTRNDRSVDEFFKGRESSRELYGSVVRAASGVGEMSTRVSRSQIAFRRKKGFAWVWIPSQYLKGDRPPLVLSLALPRHDRSSRWKEVVEPRPGRFMHHLELRNDAEVDGEVVGWLREAWASAG